MREMRTSHFRADVVSTGRGLRDAPRAPEPGVASRARRVLHERRGYPQGRVRFVTGMAVIVAVAVGTFGIEAYVRAGHDQARITALQADLAALQQRIAADEQVVTNDRRHVAQVAAQAGSARRALARFSWALHSVPSEAQVAGVRSEFAGYAACIPQLQREIAGLGISWKVNPGKPSIDFFRLSTNAPISTSCASALTGR
ncbi:MAG: hypothetical protein ACRDPA_07180 [Solirubrobacteraceae bacterium]